MYSKWVLYIVLFFMIGMPACKQPSSTLFMQLEPGETGIDFKNTLKETETANVLAYAYFYNGGGVAIGDINNDGLPDILFTGNMVANRLYLNKGDFRFEDITQKSGIAAKQGWCSGVAMADVNADGKLDIYICRSADADPVRRENLLFINNGDLSFTEQAKEYGLADQGYSTQAAFFDYDKDDDIDMFLINHSLQEYANGSFENIYLRRERRPEFASKLYRNDNGRFTDVSERAGIVSNVLTFGLGISVSDINQDGWPDVYVSNDFNEPDYLFVNNRNGTFSENLKACMDEVSLYSMGTDCADYNNDGLTDIISLDMLPEGNKEQKMHSGAENFDKFQTLFQQGFYFQYSRNMLHRNNGDGTFSEVGRMAGVSKTDWSWAALLSDFDNDGHKDLFVTNGYAKDFTDMDFIKYRFERERVEKTDRAALPLLKKMPAVSIPNYIFQNNGKSAFTNKTTEWGFNKNTISSGAAYADLNNDGATDLVINNINEEAGIYKNNQHELKPGNNFLKLRLIGSPGNTAGIGARVKLYCGDNLYYQEQMPVRGFQSSVDPVLNFGLDESTVVDSVIIIWPDDKMQKVGSVPARQLLVVNWQQARLKWTFDSTATDKKIFTEIKAPDFLHKENQFNDFSVQPLMPGYLSRQGPCMAKADINNDGREDLFIGGAKGRPGRLFIQAMNGSFTEKDNPAILADSAGENVASIFFDANGDGYPDLYVANGGYEFPENDDAFRDLLYFNDGKGNFSPHHQSLPAMRFPKGCVQAADINGDGAMDLFVGGRVVPGRYPASPPSKILINDRKGNFSDATVAVCPALQYIGMVTDAAWLDINGDNLKDLVIVGEWMPLKIFINHQGKLKDESSRYIPFASGGLWNKILAGDFDDDGDVDLVIGNSGSNTEFAVNEKEPLSIYYKDFDGNGSMDPILCYFIDGVSYPAASRDDLVDQLPGLKKKFLEYHTYSNAVITDIFTETQLKDARLLKAEITQTILLENKGGNGFELKPLPPEAQYAPVYCMAALDVNHDGKKDMILTGNNAWTRIKLGRYKANHGVVLLGNGKNSFTYAPQVKSGLNIREDTRALEVVRSGTQTTVLFGVNDGALRAFRLN